MTFRKIVSLSIAFSFSVLMVTGILSYIQDYSRTTATLHTVFGFIFSLGAVLHLTNNFKAIRNYSKGKLILGVFAIAAFLFSGAYFQLPPFSAFIDFGAKLKANSKKGLNQTAYEIVEMDLSKDMELSIDLLRSQHYWHPQMAVWVEDSLGNYIETIFVSNATAKDIFLGGRSKNNFKEFDGQKAKVGQKADYRRVNALPVWSHNRGVQYEDGMYVPTKENPLPDAISGATIKDNFKLISTIDELEHFTLKIELNVAFDDNEYYSEFDFPEDETYHSGTGQLGQPSIIFETEIDLNDNKKYYLMDLVGHGHRSGQTGELYKDLSKLTTALEIVERIVVGVKVKET